MRKLYGLGFKDGYATAKEEDNSKLVMYQKFVDIAMDSVGVKEDAERHEITVEWQGELSPEQIASIVYEKLKNKN